MPATFNLADDSQVALSASVKDDAGFVDASATLAWSSSDATAVSVSAATGDTTSAVAQGAPGSTATVTLSVVDATGTVVNDPAGNPLTDTLDVTVTASADTTVGITTGDVTHK